MDQIELISNAANSCFKRVMLTKTEPVEFFKLYYQGVNKFKNVFLQLCKCFIVLKSYLNLADNTHSFEGKLSKFDFLTSGKVPTL